MLQSSAQKRVNTLRARSSSMHNMHAMHIRTRLVDRLIAFKSSYALHIFALLRATVLLLIAMHSMHSTLEYDTTNLATLLASMHRSTLVICILRE